ncbi:hypothetical protein P171DRAFT_433937 [Karstenula rhodostoma CBS 690.94]|uniref:Uncharacterized protein n=1 Tax=Karstenula rhodostoma CBS 690.94 TaxID=1392251 RepID=A0A9P4U9S1_9PLEO|nr:hypothetical protein P171DRAFT_433937 [Karstenula rhodostoma CBS 690.94]
MKPLYGLSQQPSAWRISQRGRRRHDPALRQSDPELQDAGPIEIRERFNKWLKSGEEAPDDSYRYMACVLVDSATLNSVDRWMKDKTLEDDRLTLFDARGRTSV